MLTPSRLFHLVVVPTLALLGACSSKKDYFTLPRLPPFAPHGMSWPVDGAALSTTTLQSQKYPTAISVAGFLPASNAAYLLLEFFNAMGPDAFGPTAVGSATYRATAGSISTSYYAGASGSGTLTGTGTIIVTTLTATKVTGTFTGINVYTGATKSITNGIFNVGL